MTARVIERSAKQRNTNVQNADRTSASSPLILGLGRGGEGKGDMAKAKFRMNQEVVITSTRYLDGHSDTGFVIGIERYTSESYLFLVSTKQFLSLLNTFRYKVVYERGNKLFKDYFLESELDAASNRKKRV